MRRRRVLQRREQTEKRSVAGLELAQAFEKRGKAKRFLQEERTGGQLHIRKALGKRKANGWQRRFFHEEVIRIRARRRNRLNGRISVYNGGEIRSERPGTTR